MIVYAPHSASNTIIWGGGWGVTFFVDCILYNMSGFINYPNLSLPGKINNKLNVNIVFIFHISEVPGGEVHGKVAALAVPPGHLLSQGVTKQ